MKHFRQLLIPLIVLGALAFSLAGVALAREMTTSDFFHAVQDKEVEFIGTVEAINGDIWTVNGRTLIVPSSAEIKDTIVVGQIVTVEASLAADGTLTAREVKLASLDHTNPNDDLEEDSNSNEDMEENSNDDIDDDVFENDNEDTSDSELDDDSGNSNDQEYDDDNANPHSHVDGNSGQNNNSGSYHDDDDDHEGGKHEGGEHGGGGHGGGNHEGDHGGDDGDD